MPQRGWLVAMILAATLGGATRADDWPQWLGPKRDGVWRETGIVDTLPKDGPPVKWRVPVAEGYAGPAVANGKVFVTDWTKTAAPAEGGGRGRAKIPGQERVLCLEEATGKRLWAHEYDCPYAVSYAAGPRCTPLVAGGRVYTLGTMGHLFCLEETTGQVVWSKHFPTDFKAKVPMWGFAGHPLLDGDRLVCLVGGADGALAVAFHKDTGKEIWRALDAAEPGYCPPTLVEGGGKRQLIIWHPESVNSLEPETGKIYWSQPFPIKAGLSIPTPRQDGDRLFVTAFYDGPMMLQLAADKPGSRILWRGRGTSERKTDGLHSIMPTPVLKDGYIYGVCSYGQLRCLNLNTGERVWETLKPIAGKEERWGNAFLIPHEDRYFLFNEGGELLIAKLLPDGYQELSRAKVLEPTNKLVNRPVVWMHPAFANRCMYARNDKEIVCFSLAK